MPNYNKKFKINTTKYIASDKDLDMSLKEIQERHSTLEPITSGAKSGHFINGDFNELDESGESIPNKNMNNQYIKLGSGNFIGESEKTYLGDPNKKEMDNMVLGQQLKEVLNKIIELIPSIVKTTQLGPQSPMPQIQADITQISQDIEKITSNKHFIELNE